jgi:acyl-CoA synthetase (AMP-forming)/AMP-acid ligase II
MSGAEHLPHELGFAVVKDGSRGEEIERQAFVDRALRVSRGLQGRGLRKGSVVVLRGEPSVSWAVTFAGVLLGGGLPAPIHARSTKPELARVMATARADFAVVSAGGPAPDLVGQDQDERIITFEHIGKDLPSIEEMFALEPASPVLCRDTDLGVVMQTSGTTGHPKCVVHTHASHLEFIDRWSELTMTEEDRALSFLPLNHQSGLLLSWLSAYALGVPYYQLNPFSLAGFWDAVRTYGITWTSLIAPVPAYMLEAEPSAEDRNHKLRFVAGSRNPNEVVELERRFGIRLMRPYGSTETTIVAMSVDYDRPEVQGLTVDELASCAGPPVRDWAFRIMGEDGCQLPHSTTGDLEVRGPSLFSSYLNDAEATAKAFTEDGWFRTGDRGYVNEHGELFFVERAGNAIRRNGEMISAAEVEATLLLHPGVRDAVVVAVPDELRGQEVRACIVRAPGFSVTAQELFEHCLASLARFKVPRYIDFWDEFPRTSTLKVSRGELRSDPGLWADRYQKA